ncbi:MAG: hypothetical protein L0Z50_05300, partial [Verrucomicrobiales bacterium]|nr:hypothetical protein [Verrucomicrobiales bacterium]
MNFFPAPPSDAENQLAPEPERALWQQKRRRTTIVIAGCIICLLAFLVWLLLRPSAPASPGRKLKNLVFGNRVTDAVEQAVGNQGDGIAPASRPSTGAPTARGTQGGGENRPERQAPDDSPANPRPPAQVAPSLPAPPERSIGWLDRFFGGETASRPPQAGEGGTDLRQR